MTKLFGRAFTLNLSGRDLSGFDVNFEVVRSSDSTQNTASVSIINLAQESRRFLHEQEQGVLVELRAGYRDVLLLPLLFRGRLRVVSSKRQDANWITSVETGDGDVARTAEISTTYPEGFSVKGAIQDMVKVMRAEAGNLISAFKDTPDKKLDGQLIVHERGDRTLQRMLDSMNLEGSWQNDALQVVKKGGYLSASAVSMTPETGLIGNAELQGKRTLKGKTTGALVKFDSLLNTELAPGRRVVLDSETWSGDCVVRKATHTGDSSGGPWQSSVEALIL
jgi:hypothetical protein